jgi:hypothetical protein
MALAWLDSDCVALSGIRIVGKKDGFNVAQSSMFLELNND